MTRQILGATLAALAAIAALTATVAEAQSPDARAKTWLEAVRAHAPGELDAPLSTIAKWSREDVLSAVTRARPDAATLKKALALHTDIAMVEHAMADTGGGGPVAAMLLIDGRDSGAAGGSAQWAIGQHIAQVLLGQPGGEPTVRLWYRATGALLQQWGDCATLRAHAETGEAALKGDAVLALYQGTRHQAYADRRVQFHVAAAGRSTGRSSLVMGEGMNTGGLPSPGTYARVATGGRLIEDDVLRPTSTHRFAPKSTAVELDSAERELRRAAGLDPTLVEARVRLAHVLLEKNKQQEAAELLRAVVTAPLPPFLDFYSALLLGRAEERLGRTAEARTAYERAVARFPNAQSARIALSRLVVAQGQASQGLASVVEVVGPNVAPSIDPWSAYFRFHDPDASTLLAQLKAGVK